jgi:hypothetical protein
VKSCLNFAASKSGAWKELINPELLEIKIDGGGIDMVFLPADGEYLYLGFEIGCDKGDIVKHLNYDARLIQRDGRKVITVIVYTSDVNVKLEEISGETLVHNPHIV